MTPEPYYEVLVDAPGGGDGVYTYAVPPGLEVQPGDILSVPFGPQQRSAIAIRPLEDLPPELPADKVRPIAEVLCRGFFAPAYWALLEQVAETYATPLMAVVRTALPPGLLTQSQQRLRLNPEALAQHGDRPLSAAAQRLLELLLNAPPSGYSRRYLQQKVKGAAAALRDLRQRGWIDSWLVLPGPTKAKTQLAVSVTGAPDLGLTDRQREVLGTLQELGGELWLRDLMREARCSEDTVRALVTQGCCRIAPRERLRRATGPDLAGDRPKDLTPAQAEALAQLAQLQPGETALLHGVTGSGKTEVYLQAIAPLLAQGQSALVLVPEIGLTPQLTDRFRQRFGEEVLVYHSGLGEGERYDSWRQMLTGQPWVVIGTRSAVFAPLPELGLIILDEEHDGSFKQEQPMPCYHARTIAQWRSERQPCRLLLGSATPALESWQRTHAGPSHYLTLPERVQARPLPPIRVVDMRQELADGNRSLFSRPLQAALSELVGSDRQGLLFIHRRGHSTFVSCRSCGFTVECPHCDVSLAYHLAEVSAQPTLRCHYCNYIQAYPKRCPSCDSPYLKHFGSGTQRVEQELSRLFPQLSVTRFDSDTTRGKDGHRRALEPFRNGETQLLLGTQMLTKGLDLPQVTLVGVVAADGLLHLPDFRANERALQTLIQVAGRAGRGDDPGEAIVQTYTPEHPVIGHLQQRTYGDFLAEELAERHALGYPPTGRLLLLRLSAPEESQVIRAAERLAEYLRLVLSPDIGLLGPAPAGIPRVARRWRWQILLKGPAGQPWPLDWEELRRHCPRDVSLLIDVDPLSA